MWIRLPWRADRAQAGTCGAATLREPLRMLEEHEAIQAATVRLGDVARAHHNDQVTQLARKLELHARSEEELFYPAAVLMGDVVRARLRGATP